MRAKQAVDGLRRFARRFHFGLPHAHLWRGLYDVDERTPSARVSPLARARSSSPSGCKRRTSAARAHLEIGRHLRPEAYGRRHHLDQAAEIFDGLGCTLDRDRALAELAARDPPRGAPQ